MLLTGGAGFLGHHLVRAWRDERPGDHVLVLDTLTYAADAARIGETALLVGDVADPAAVHAAFDRLGRVDALVHLAAETHVDRSIVSAPVFVRTNVVGTQVLLDVARERGVGTFVHVSTDEVYGSIRSGSVDESAPFRPSSPYAASKAAGDHLVTAAFLTHRLPTLVVRPANAFGTGQHPEKFLPLFCRAAVRGEPMPLYGDGSHQRDWLWAGDFVSAITCLLDNGERGTAYNVPGGGPVTNRAVAHAICRQAGCPRSLVTPVPDRPGHDRRYAMRGARIRALGWRRTRLLVDELPALVEEARRA